jgi:antitoxin HicB
MRDFRYPALLTEDPDAGGYTVRFRDFREAVTQGQTKAEAMTQAADCLEEAVAGRIRRGDEIPEASATRRGECGVPLPAPMAAKAALYLALKQAGIGNLALARRIHVDEKEIRRMLDPRHPTKLPRIQLALDALGVRLVLSMEEAA